jgi:uncharacterized Zn-binding protein involved in type VI secretion
MASKLLRPIFTVLLISVSMIPVSNTLLAEDENLDAQLAASMKELESLTQEANKANSDFTAAVKEQQEQNRANAAEMNDQADPRVMIKLTYPLGISPKVFTSGWTFGVEAVYIPTLENDDMETRDLSLEVQWEGSGSFEPAQGPRSHPAFSAPGDNTITLSVMIDGKKISKTFHVQAVPPDDYARVGSQAACPADSHHCPACPHSVFGFVETGSPNVMINGKPAAREGDTGTHLAHCCGPNTFKIIRGDSEVLIDGRPAAKIDPAYGETQHCGGKGRLLRA